MSKDKYRPSVADFEVARSRKTDDERWREHVRATTRPLPRELIHPPDPYEDIDYGWNVTTPGTPEEPWQPIEDELIEDDWYPQNLRVKSQVIRYNEQGRMRVDVTFEWDELDAADGYFIRIAEA